MQSASLNWITFQWMNIHVPWSSQAVSLAKCSTCKFIHIGSILARFFFPVFSTPFLLQCSNVVESIETILGCYKRHFTSIFVLKYEGQVVRKLTIWPNFQIHVFTCSHKQAVCHCQSFLLLLWLWRGWRGKWLIMVYEAADVPWDSLVRQHHL